ncbi:hypothetical protein C1G86_0592 [Dehalococcoides mccartyi]|uniref:IPT/TIG domain-containing protein n=2 Tax=Dehalococcoides mccartyi TaxID=61435 RepID=A0A328ELT8_9CHLR|nr:MULTISPECIES: hypothetical protein [Dehalococcoides]AGG06260.1 hypothetical protein dcmb_633 [Dehalococcoides mccartyi DCMB5]RAL69580.1 hypothetical protein C1G87_0597 [Dehalococcoides mccartyi]RAL70899.1 hypothetical protein C1G86_0592 [Dehalococcoides mccartyi]
MKMKKDYIIKLIATLVISGVLFFGSATVNKAALEGQLYFSDVIIKVGTKLTVYGQNFLRQSNVKLFYDDQEVALGATNQLGEFTLSFIIPPSGRGLHAVKAIDADYNMGSGLVLMESWIELSENEAAIGETVNIRGTGFTPLTSVSFYYSDTPLIVTPSIVKADLTGSFSVNFAVPERFAGVYLVEVRQGDYINSQSLKANVWLDINPEIGLGKALDVGTELNIHGKGFKPNGQVDLRYDGVSLLVVNIDDKGTFSAQIVIPAGAGISHSLTLDDGQNRIVREVWLENTSPSAPVITLPASGEALSYPFTFGWEGVNDASGVEYVFQIASDSGFGSILLEIKGIKVSQYILTDNEDINNSPAASFYWRVKAVDGAGNESGWSETGVFDKASLVQNLGLVVGVGAGLVAIILFMWWAIRNRR